MSFDIGRWRAREWFVLGCATLVLLVSLSDWYGVSVREPALPTTPWQDVETANAWRASTAWTLAIGTTVFAAALWLVHRGQAAQPGWARRTAAVLVLAALGAVSWQYVALGDVHRTAAATRTQVLTVSTGASVQAYTSELALNAARNPVDRDDLVAGSTDGYRAGPRWGMTAGTALLALILLALLTTPATPAAAPSPDPGDRPENGEDPPADPT